MSKNNNTWEGRRALTDNSSKNPALLTAAARDLMGLSQLSEAVALGAKAQDDTLLKEIIDLASAEGNFFLFNSAFNNLKEKTVERGLIQTLKEVAEKNGKGLYAEQAAAWLEANH